MQKIFSLDEVVFSLYLYMTYVTHSEQSSVYCLYLNSEACLEITAMRDHFSWRTTYSRQEVLNFNLIEPGSKDHLYWDYIFMGNRAVFQDGYHCMSTQTIQHTFRYVQTHILFLPVVILSNLVWITALCQVWEQRMQQLECQDLAFSGKGNSLIQSGSGLELSKILKSWSFGLNHQLN